jgi:Spy/CpxP family protein refolding chaperone
MKKTNLISKLVLAIFITGLFTISSYAQEKSCPNHEQQAKMGQCKGGSGFGFIKDLTPEQKKQIDVLKQKLIKESLPIKNQIEEKQAHLKTISTGDNVDMVAVNKTIDEIYALKAELQKKKMQFKQDVRKLLTEDQKLNFDIHCCVGNGEGCGHNNNMQGNMNGCGNDHAMGNGCQTGQGQGQCCKNSTQSNGCGNHQDGNCCKNQGNGQAGCQHSMNGQGCQNHGDAKGCSKDKESASPSKCCKSGQQKENEIKK